MPPDGDPPSFLVNALVPPRVDQPRPVVIPPLKSKVVVGRDGGEGGGDGGKGGAAGGGGKGGGAGGGGGEGGGGGGDGGDCE